MLVEAPALRRYWYVVAEAGDIESRPQAVRLLGDDIVIWRGPGAMLIAAPDRCPHREAPLSEGHVVDGCLVCCYHGWTFGAEGRCVRVPSAAEGVPIPPRSNLSTIHVVERYGLVWVCLDEPVAGIPEIAAEHDATYRRINTGVETWRTSATRMTDNFMDISHFPYVHVGHVRDPRQHARPEDLDGATRRPTSAATATRPKSATRRARRRPASPPR